MPKIFKRLLPVALSIAFSVATGGLGSVSLLSVLGRVAASVVVSGLTGAFSSASKNKAKSASAKSFAVKASGQTLSFRQPITSRKIIYGEIRTSGPLINIGSSSSNKYLHLIIPLASHECEAIDEVWLDDDVIANDMLDGSGMVNSGKYSGKVRIRKHTGGDGQTADELAVAEITGWTSAHRGRGVCYMYIRFELDRTLFPNGAPNPSAVVRGKRIFDSRDGAARWSPNVALFAYDYLTDTKLGIGASIADVSTSETEAAANANEEIVDTQAADTSVSSIATGSDIITLSGILLNFQRGDRVEVVTTGVAPSGLATGTDYFVIPYQFKGTPRIKLAASLTDAISGTAIDITSAGSGTHTIRKTGEPRYFGGGVIDTEVVMGENLRDILSGMAGKISNTGGEWKIFSGVYRAPAVTLDESHLRAPISVSTRVTRAERFNGVKGIYVSPMNNWQPADYPLVTVASHVTADMGEQIITDLDLPFTQRSTTAVRIAQIALNKHRQEIRLPYPCNLHGLQLQPCDTVNISNARMGWDEKPFEVEVWKLSVEEQQGAPVIVIDMLLSETAAGVYSWDSDDELAVDPAPNTNLPDAGTVEAVSGLSIDSIPVGDNTYRVVANWTEHVNAFVRERGSIQIEYKPASSDTWLQVAPVPGYSTRADIITGSLGTLYDLRVRALNGRGVPSSWNTLEALSIGSGGGIGTTIDDGLAADSVGLTVDDGSVADAVGTEEDYGGVA